LTCELDTSDNPAVANPDGSVVTDRRLYIIGAGGHAKVVIATAQSHGFALPSLSVVDDNPHAQGRLLLGLRVTGTSAEVLGNRLARAVLAIGDNLVRSQLSESACCEFVSLIHRASLVHDSVSVGQGCVIFAGAVIQPDTVLGRHVIINTGASVDHDCRIDDAVHVAPGARLAGAVTVGARSLIGIGAVIAPGIAIGQNATVGAGAAVIRDVADGATVVGVPARAINTRARK
jgi:sugar O-acyltransferase (sialic acid O-acetyltransferase NeuD family)